MLLSGNYSGENRSHDHLSLFTLWALCTAPADNFVGFFLFLHCALFISTPFLVCLVVCCYSWGWRAWSGQIIFFNLFKSEKWFGRVMSSSASLRLILSIFSSCVCVCAPLLHQETRPETKGLESRPLTIMKRVLEIKISSSLGRGVVDTSVGWFSGSQCNDLTVSGQSH